MFKTHCEFMHIHWYTENLLTFRFIVFFSSISAVGSLLLSVTIDLGQYIQDLSKPLGGKFRRCLGILAFWQLDLSIYFKSVKCYLSLSPTLLQGGHMSSGSCSSFYQSCQAMQRFWSCGETCHSSVWSFEWSVHYVELVFRSPEAKI